MRPGSTISMSEDAAWESWSLEIACASARASAVEEKKYAISIAAFPGCRNHAGVRDRWRKVSAIVKRGVFRIGRAHQVDACYAFSHSSDARSPAGDHELDERLRPDATMADEPRLPCRQIHSLRRS